MKSHHVARHETRVIGLFTLKKLDVLAEQAAAVQEAIRQISLR